MLIVRVGWMGGRIGRGRVGGRLVRRSGRDITVDGIRWGYTCPGLSSKRYVTEHAMLNEWFLIH